jgi:hypothetical protein
VNPTTADVIAGLAMAAGIVGIIVPILPGVALIAVALLVWAILIGGWPAWIATVLALTFLLLGQVLKYLLPGRKMSAAGVPRSTMLIGAIAAVAGFFLIPVVGVVIGFLIGVFACELRRLRRWRPAWDSTWVAMKATGFSILIELASALLAVSIWAGTAIVT